MSRITETLRAFNEAHTAYKLVLVLAALVGFGMVAKDYIELPGRVSQIEASTNARASRIETVHDSLADKFKYQQVQLDKIQSDGTITRCIVVAQAKRQNPVECFAR